MKPCARVAAYAEFCLADVGELVDVVWWIMSRPRNAMAMLEVGGSANLARNLLSAISVADFTCKR